MTTYDLVVTTTGEFSTFHRMSPDNDEATAKGHVQCAVATTINRVNGIFEKEVAVRLVLHPNDDLIYLDAATDPYTDNDADALIDEAHNNITLVVGVDNFDLGHVMSTGGGGLAYFGVCDATKKGGGVTGSNQPVGDAYDVDYVAHEVGHQFHANHTFAGTNGNCSGNGEAAAAVEPGSGTTIMAYAGICGADNVQRNSNDYFNAQSYHDIRTFVTSGAGSCGDESATGNTPPAAAAGADLTIPRGAAFRLDGSGVDADPDTELTYCWETRDSGVFKALQTADDGSLPIFRSWSPTTTTEWTFPRYIETLDHRGYFAEQVPQKARTMNFRLTVRDNQGGVGFDQRVVTVTSGKFEVTQPTWTFLDTKDIANSVHVHWDHVAIQSLGYDAVDIYLSIDGGETWPYMPATGITENGFTDVPLPAVTTSKAKVKVQPQGAPFFAVGPTLFQITDGEASLLPYASCPSGEFGTCEDFSVCASSVFRDWGCDKAPDWVDFTCYAAEFTDCLPVHTPPPAVGCTETDSGGDGDGGDGDGGDPAGLLEPSVFVVGSENDTPAIYVLGDPEIAFTADQLNTGDYFDISVDGGMHGVALDPGSYTVTDLSIGSHTVTVTVINSDDVAYANEGASSTLDLQFGELGDTTMDGMLNVMDVVQLIQYILNEGPPDDFAAALSDLNQDTAINVMDVVALVDKALGLNQ